MDGSCLVLIFSPNRDYSLPPSNTKTPDIASASVPATIAARCHPFWLPLIFTVSPNSFRAVNLFAWTQGGMIQLNVLAPSLLALAAIPGFVARGKGTLINISSVLALAPEGFNGSYSGTKAYILNLSLRLQQEIASKGVRIQVVLPGAIRTKWWTPRSSGSTAARPSPFLRCQISPTGKRMSRRGRTCSRTCHLILPQRAIAVLPLSPNYFESDRRAINVRRNPQ